DNAFNVNLRYTFAFGLSIGGYWEKLKYSVDYSTFQVGTLTDLDKTSWRADVAYQIGPHTIGLQYGASSNLKGTTTAAQFDGSNTAGNVWILGYAYSLSKRTSLFGYYTRVQNQANAAYSGIVFYGVGPVAGADPRYLGVGLRHTFGRIADGDFVPKRAPSGARFFLECREVLGAGIGRLVGGNLVEFRPEFSPCPPQPRRVRKRPPAR